MQEKQAQERLRDAAKTVTKSRSFLALLSPRSRKAAEEASSGANSAAPSELSLATVPENSKAAAQQQQAQAQAAAPLQKTPSKAGLFARIASFSRGNSEKRLRSELDLGSAAATAAQNAATAAQLQAAAAGSLTDRVGAGAGAGAGLVCMTPRDGDHSQLIVSTCSRIVARWPLRMQIWTLRIR